MSVLYASVRIPKPLALPVRYGRYSAVSAKLARKVAPKLKKLSSAPGWTKEGYGSWEQFQDRSRFMHAATTASTQLIQDYEDLRPMLSRFKEIAGTSEYYSWNAVQDEVSTIQEVPDWSNLPPAAQEALLDFHAAALRWQGKYNLFPAPSMQHGGPPADDWVLVMACAGLQGPYSLNGGVVVYSPPLSYSETQLNIELRGWDGTESAADWHERTMKHVDALLREQVAQAEATLSDRGFNPLPVRKRPGLKHLDRAARWQVLGESWDEFLARESEAEGSLLDEANIRKRTLVALKRVGIDPRLEMKSSSPGRIY